MTQPPAQYLSHLKMRPLAYRHGAVTAQADPPMDSIRPASSKVPADVPRAATPKSRTGLAA